MTLTADHHVHSDFSDDAVSSVAANVAAAHARGLTEVAITDHVRADTSWVPDLVRAVRSVPVPPDLRVRCGVEVKVLDRHGRLDLPAALPELDRVLIADHQYPGRNGPVGPAEVRQRLATGELVRSEVVETLVLATARALRHAPRPQLAHLFSLLPKIGLSEREVTDDLLDLLVSAAVATDAVVEANEKWACPGPSVLAAFHAAGVPVVASTDSHRAADVGRYSEVPERLRAAGVTAG